MKFFLYNERHTEKFEKYEENWHNSWPIMLFYVILKSERKFA